MSQTVQADWINKVTGFHPINDAPSAGAAAPAATAASAPSALAGAGSDQQSQEFKGKFEPVLATIDGHLAYTAEHAEEKAHEAQAAKRAALASAYGVAMKGIDPADEKKGKPGIDKVLAGAGSVSAAIGKFRQEAEKAFNDWQSRQPKYDEMGQQLAEMEQWGHPKAAGLRGPYDGVKTETDARRYAPASAAFDKLPAQFGPVHDDYVKQRAAQAQYEPARQALDPRLAAAQQCEFKTLTKLQAPLAGAGAAMDAAVGAKDYVKALASEQGVETQAGAFEAALAALQAKKQAYDDARSAAQPAVDAAKGAPEHKKLADLKGELDTVQSAMEASAQAEDFDKAKQGADDLGGKAQQYKQAVDALEQQKKAYEDALAPLQPRITASQTSTFKALEPAQAAVAEIQKTMEGKAADEDYVAALKDAQGLGSRLDDYEKQLADMTAKQKQYTDARQALQPKLDVVGKPPHPKLKADEDALGQVSASMDKAAADENFDAALQTVQDAGSKADAYGQAAKELDDKKAAYQSSWDKDIQPHLDKMTQSDTGALSKMQQPILTQSEEIKKLAEQENYDEATSSVATLKRMIDEYESASANEVWVVEFKGKKYSGTKQELVAVQAAIQAQLIKEAFSPLKNKADYHSGYYNDLKTLNDQQYVIGWIVSTMGGADLGALGTACSGQDPVIAALKQAIDANSKDGEGAYHTAVNAVNAAGTALTTYMAALDIGAARAITTFQAIEVVSFAIAGACGAAILAPAGSTLAATMGANALSGAGFGALEEAAKQTGGALTGIDAPKSAGDAALKIGKAAALSGIGSALGSGAGKMLKGAVCKTIFERLAIENPVVKKKVEDFVEGALAGAVQTVVSSAPDVYQGKMTGSQLAVLVAENMIGGGMGGIFGNSLKSGKLDPKAQDLIAAGLVATGTEAKALAH